MQTFSLEQAAVLKRDAPFAVWRVIKRLLNDVNGHDVIGSKIKLRKYLYEKCNLQYETGTFQSLSDKMVTFVSITDAAEVLQKMIANLQANGAYLHVLNLKLGHLLNLILTDRGGHETKLVLTTLNSLKEHSNK